MCDVHSVCVCEKVDKVNTFIARVYERERRVEQKSKEREREMREERERGEGKRR